MKKMDHVGFVAWRMRERLRTKEEGEQDWWAAVGDTGTYPDERRDWEGTGECCTILGCRRKECAGGKLRLYVSGFDRAEVATKTVNETEVVKAMKQKKTPLEQDIVAASHGLDQGHDKFGQDSHNSAAGRAFASIHKNELAAARTEYEEPEKDGKKRKAAEEQKAKGKRGKQAASATTGFAFFL